MTEPDPPLPHGGAFYDQHGVLDRYTSTRPAGTSNPRAVMEEPAPLEELGDVAGARVLDLGCGDAALGTWLTTRGAASYVGVDASSEMVRRAARTLTDPRSTVQHGTIETFDAAAGSADLVISRLALHYVQDFDSVLARCHRWLAPGGRLVATVVHPVVTSHDARSSTAERRTSRVVDEYFAAGPRPRQWMGGTVTFHHRTVEQYVGALCATGFALTTLRECAPRRALFEDDEEYLRRRRIPLFLLLAAR